MPVTLRTVAIALLLASLHATPALAQWTGRGEAGLVVASGNTDTKAANAKLAVKREAGTWTHDASFAGVYAADEIGTTAQRWEAALQSRFDFSTRNFVFGGLRYEDDNFSGFEHQGTLSAGLGHQFIDSEDTQLSAQAGVGYKFFETRDVLSPLGVVLEPGDTDSAMALIGSANYSHQFNASTGLVNKLTLEYTSDNTFLQNELALQVRMSDKLALAVGYAVRHNTDPPPGFEETDTLTTVNIVYEVK